MLNICITIPLSVNPMHRWFSIPFQIISPNGRHMAATTSLASIIISASQPTATQLSGNYTAIAAYGGRWPKGNHTRLGAMFLIENTALTAYRTSSPASERDRKQSVHTIAHFSQCWLELVIGWHNLLFVSW